MPAFLIREPRCLDEFWRAFEVLLKEHRSLNAAWIALQNRGPILQVRHDVIRDFEVVTKQIEFREFLIGPVNAIETRHCDLLASRLDDQVASWPVQAEKFFNRNNRAAFLFRSFYFFFRDRKSTRL